MPALHKPAATEDSIRVMAYHLWEQDGRPHGRDLEFWHKAAAIIGTGKPVRAARKGPVTAAAAKPAGKPRVRAKTKA